MGAVLFIFNKHVNVSEWLKSGNVLYNGYRKRF